jgi:hypothetical protein
MAIVERAPEVESLPSDLVQVGFSSGVLAAQSLAQTRPGATWAVLCYSAVALGEWRDNWPATGTEHPTHPLSKTSLPVRLAAADTGAT